MLLIQVHSIWKGHLLTRIITFTPAIKEAFGELVQYDEHVTSCSSLALMEIGLLCKSPCILSALAAEDKLVYQLC